MADLLRDPRTLELLRLLWAAPDRNIGVAIVDLPETLRDDGLFTEWIGAKLIEVIQRNHHHVGAGNDRKLVIDPMWNLADFSLPYRKRIWQFLKEDCSKDIDERIRHRVRLTQNGEMAAAAMSRQSEVSGFRCSNCGGPLQSIDVEIARSGEVDLRWCPPCRHIILAAETRSIAGYKRALSRFSSDSAAWRDLLGASEGDHASQLAQELVSAEFRRYHTLPRHIFGKELANARDAETLGQLWHFITGIAIVVLETTRGGRNAQDHRSVDPMLQEVRSSLHRLGIAWADSPPYQPLTRQETIDKLQSIANRLERDEATGSSATADTPPVATILAVSHKNIYPPTTTDIDDLVTLSQVAPLTGLTKRTLERYLSRQELPEPDFRGGDGKSHKWHWKNLRPALEKIAQKNLPERFPGSRIV
jgi:hypothetical protein